MGIPPWVDELWISPRLLDKNMSERPFSVGTPNGRQDYEATTTLKTPIVLGGMELMCVPHRVYMLCYMLLVL